MCAARLYIVLARCQCPKGGRGKVGGVQSWGYSHSVGVWSWGHGPTVWSQGDGPGVCPRVCPVGMVLRNMVPGGTALPACGQKDTRLWKHYLPATSFAIGNNWKASRQVDDGRVTVPQMSNILVVQNKFKINVTFFFRIYNVSVEPLGIKPQFLI